MTPAVLALAMAAQPVIVAPNEELVIRGSVSSSIDGAVLAAGDLFDFDAGGLRATAVAPGEVRLRPTGAIGPSCAIAGMASPCLVPRVPELAHARLVTTAEFRASLSGGMLASVEPLPVPPPSRAPLYALLAGLVALASAIALWATARARASTPLGRVHHAAKRARRALRGDPTLASARAQIDALIHRAETLDAARRAALTALAKIDRAGLERRRAAWASAQTADAREAVDWLTAESAEAARITADLESSLAGLERIAAALRVTALRAREHRGTRARIASDPVDAIAMDLELREEALREV